MSLGVIAFLYYVSYFFKSASNMRTNKLNEFSDILKYS